MSNKMLEVTGLTKRFGSFTAVNNLSFTVNRGEVFGFLGPNGAGKSTSMRMITNFIPATSGKVTIDGISGGDNDLLIKKKIGYLPESTPLYTDMSVEEYLKFVGELRGLRGTILKRQMDDMIDVCSLTKMIKRPIGQLSKGYKQRVGLAQAMIHEPELLILDEPISGLDPNQIIEIRELIREIGSKKTVIYSSHILPEVAATCDRILIINNGELVTIGTPEEVTRQFTGKTTFIMKILGEPVSMKSVFEKMKEVVSIQIDSDSAVAHVKIECNSDETFGDQLFDTVVSNGWKLRELTHYVTTLEDVFTQLTGSK